MSSSWALQPLGQLCDVLDSKRRPVTKRDRVAGPYPYYGATGIQDYVAEWIFDEPLVLVGEDGAKWGSGDSSAFPIEGKTWVNNHAHVLRPRRDKILDKWLIFYLNHSDLTHFVSGMTVPKLNQENLRRIPVPVPPLPEQQRIVGILDQAFEGIAKAKANAERNLANAKELYLKKLELEFSERADWEVSPLKALTTKIGSGATPKGGRESYVSEGIPLVRSMNVYDDGFKNDELAFLSNAQAEKLNGVTLWDGDVLLNITGASVARCCVAPSHVIGGRVNQHVSIIRPSADRLLSEFLHLNLTAPPQKKRLLGVGEQGGSTRQAITKSEIEAFVLHYPQDLNEQRKIAECLHEFKIITDKQMETERIRIACLVELKSSILHQAFSGNL